MDVSQIEAFFADAKALRGEPPQWQQAPRPPDFEATWNIEDSIGALSGQLRFRCPKIDRAAPSISVIVRGGLLVARLDLEAAGIVHINPPDAYLYGLPSTVTGSHIHDWPDNRAYVLANEKFGELPYRREIPAQVRRLPQALLWLGQHINLTIGPNQRGFDVPPQTELNLR
jgi:hypothetical protein